VSLLAVLLAWIPYAAAEPEAIPASGSQGKIALPLTIFSVDWSDQRVDLPPVRAGKAWLEAAVADPWQALPWRTYTQLDFVSRTRFAMVREEGVGQVRRPVVFAIEEIDQPHWGPRISFSIPPAIAAAGKRYRVSLDVSKSNISRMGGVELLPGGALRFDEQGNVLVLTSNTTAQVGRYRPNDVLHLLFVVDVPNRQTSVQVNEAKPVIVDWVDAKATRFNGLRLDGLIPGSYARGIGQLAFDNIKIVLED